MKIIVATLVALFCALPGAATSEPGDSATYHRRVERVLSDIHAPDVVAGVSILPSFEPEYAVGISQREGRYAVVYLQSPVQIWDYSSIDRDKAARDELVRRGFKVEPSDVLAQLEARAPGDPNKIRAVRCERPIDAALGRQLTEIWLKVLKTKLKDRMGLDGTGYYFSAMVNEVRVDQTLWSPEPKSPAGRLVEIAETMKSLCQRPSGALLQTLQARTDALSRALKGRTGRAR